MTVGVTQMLPRVSTGDWDVVLRQIGPTVVRGRSDTGELALHQPEKAAYTAQQPNGVIILPKQVCNQNSYFLAHFSQLYHFLVC